MILESLSAHPALVWLDLHANSIQDDAVPAIVKFLLRNDKIRCLNIRANYLTDATVGLLAGGFCLLCSFCGQLLLVAMV